MTLGFQNITPQIYLMLQIYKYKYKYKYTYNYVSIISIN